MSDVEKPEILAAALIKETFVEFRKVMLKWSKITGQSAQLDSGYIAQHLISLLTGKHGSGWRGKGIDLDDGSEVKCASSVDGVDIPRWNHSFRKPETVDKWLASPNIYYVLFDTLTRHSSSVRVRIWMVTPALDESYKRVLKNWTALPERSYNFQLHPPVYKESNVATNECGNLELPLMFWAEENEASQVVVKFFQHTGLSTSTLIDRSNISKPDRETSHRTLPSG